MHKDLIMNLERATAWVEFMQTKPELPSKYSSEIEVIKKILRYLYKSTILSPTPQLASMMQKNNKKRRKPQIEGKSQNLTII